MHVCMQFDPIQGQGHEPFSRKFGHFQRLSLSPSIMGAANDHRFLNCTGFFFIFVLVFVTLKLSVSRSRPPVPYGLIYLQHLVCIVKCAVCSYFGFYG